MPVRGRTINIGAGRVDILADRGVREDSPQRAQSPRRKTSLVFCLRDLCGLCGELVWLQLRRAALPALESAFSPLPRLHRKEAPRETEPGQARAGEFAWGLAAVKLAVLLLEWRVRAPHASTALSGRHRPVPSEHRGLQKAGV
jgi:hypothetical protein